MTVSDYYNSHESRCGPPAGIPLVQIKSARSGSYKPFTNRLRMTREDMRSSTFYDHLNTQEGNSTGYGFQRANTVRRAKSRHPYTWSNA